MDVATTLFNKEGYQSVGVDKIAAKSGVSKLTLYRHFPSKDLLINEVLRKRKEVFLQDLSTIIQKQQSTKEQLFSFFYYYHDWFKHEDFQGCMFTHSLSELGRKSTAVVEINQDIKRDLKQILLTILSPLVKGERAHRIAYVFIILIDGCITAELTWRDQNEYSPALVAWSTAKTILESEGIMI